MNPTLTGHPAAKTWRGYKSRNELVGEIVDLECVRADDDALYSRWMPTRRERWAILLGCPVWLRVITPQLPPVSVFANFWPFGEKQPTHKIGWFKRLMQRTIIKLVGA